MATNGTTLTGAPVNMAQGVSLTDTNEKLAQMMAMFAESQAQIAALQQSRAVVTQTPTGPVIAKVAAQPVNAAIYKSAQPVKLANQAAEKRSTTSGKPCGSKSPNGLCQKCNGPFHPVLHYSLEAIIRLDGIDAPITHENHKTAKFMGISVDPNYWGNVVIVGFGKDCMNLRPHNAVGLAKALGVFKAAQHVEGVLRANGAANLLMEAAPARDHV